MDEEGASLDSGKFPWPIDHVTDQGHLYRLVPHAHRDREKGKQRRRYPNEGHFALREGEEGLSFNWNQYADEEICYSLIGITIGKSGEYLKPENYRLFKYPIDVLRGLEGANDICHTPEVHDEYPSPVGQPNNRSHVDFIYDRDNLSVRTNLSDYCNTEYDTAYCDFDYKAFEQELLQLQARLNNTPYHKDWDFAQSF